MWKGYGVCSNLASSGVPPASHDHFNHCTDNVSKFVDTFHKFIKVLTVNLSQRLNTQ